MLPPTRIFSSADEGGERANTNRKIAKRRQGTTARAQNNAVILLPFRISCPAPDRICAIPSSLAVIAKWGERHKISAWERTHRRQCRGRS